MGGVFEPGKVVTLRQAATASPPRRPVVGYDCMWCQLQPTAAPPRRLAQAPLQRASREGAV